MFYVRIPGGGRKRAVTEETPAADCKRACTGSLAERAAEMEFHALRLAQLQHEVVSAGGLEGADKALALKALADLEGTPATVTRVQRAVGCILRLVDDLATLTSASTYLISTVTDSS